MHKIYDPDRDPPFDNGAFTDAMLRGRSEAVAGLSRAKETGNQSEIGAWEKRILKLDALILKKGEAFNA